VLCSVLNSDKIKNNKDVRNNIVKFVKDPYYLKWLSHQYYDGGTIDVDKNNTGENNQ